MPFTKTCEFCLLPFETRYRRPRFCSKSCFARSRGTAAADALLRQRREQNPASFIKAQIACAQCGKEFAIKPSLVGRVKTCSKACSRLRKRAAEPVGYRQSYVGGKTISEHLRLAHERLGVDSVRGKIVHHINGQRADNSLGNLIVVKRGDHRRIHNIQRRTGRFPTAEEILSQFSGSLWLGAA